MNYLFLISSLILNLIILVAAEDEVIIEDRIVGGLTAKRGRYPYMVGMLDGNNHYCGATLIAPTWAISAAHCGGYGTHVMIGRSDLNNPMENFERIEIDYEVLHPNYSRNSNKHDVMVVKLKVASKATPIKFDDGSQRLMHGVDVTTMGWGTTCYGGPQSSKLLEVTVDVVGNGICNNQYSGQISADMMCAARAGKDACQGDSGGPLIMKGNSPENDTLVGVVSWGNGCAQAGYAGVYSRLSTHNSWVSNTISGTRAYTASDRLEYNLFYASKRVFRSWNKNRKEKGSGLRNFDHY